MFKKPSSKQAEQYYDPETDPNVWKYLQPGTILDQYIIERPLAGGGFSSVYLARQLSDQHQVAIKEYLPKKLAHRTWGNRVVINKPDDLPLFMKGRKLFIEEARTLAKFKHPNIVEVLNFFPANETVYIVMTYDYGKNLGEYIKYKNNKLSKEFILTVFPPLLDGIKALHDKQLLHLDIKPENIIIRPGGNPLLLDFGAVHPFPQKNGQTLAKVRTNGFSPIEQYEADLETGPWSDVYAIGATLRTCMEGMPPPSSPVRQKKDSLVPAQKKFNRRYPSSILKATDMALKIDPAERPQSIEELLEILLDS